jgi:chromate transporter
VNVSCHPRFGEAFRFWLKLGFISFGGPAGQIAIMHTELVDRKKWISEDRFLHALNFCMLLPGPEAQQLATYCGWLLHGTRGGLAAGILFVLPSFFILLALSWLYATHGATPWVAALFAGLKPAVLAIVVHAVFRMGRRALKRTALYGLAAAAFVAIYFLAVPFPAIVLAAAAIGWMAGSRLAGAESGPAPAADERPPSRARAARVLIVCLTLWWAPVLLLAGWQGGDGLFVRMGVFFSKAAMMTFGGAYAVLPYVAHAAVDQYQWLAPAQMMDGLGLAETTPGPLIMVLTFVGFMGGWQHPPAGMTPGLAGTIGALITTWVTFAPCFLWIFLGAPYIERLRSARRLAAAMAAVTAAVVGVVLNLAVWFAAHTLWPDGTTLDVFAAGIGLVALAGMWRWNWGVVPVVLGGAVLGGIAHGLAF